MQEKITAHGNENIRAEHETTIEITKDSELSLKGDCIIGIKASKACSDLSEELKEKLKTECEVQIKIKVGDLEETIIGRGSPDLILTNPKDTVLRKSDYIDDRTLCINCDKACKDLSREFVEKLKDPNKELNFTIETNIN